MWEQAYKSLTVHPKLKPSEKMEEKAVSILWPSTLQCSKFRIQGYSPKETSQGCTKSWVKEQREELERRLSG